MGERYGYAQAVKVRDTIYVSGQVSHDDRGNIVGRGDMEAQMRQVYANLQKVLVQYGATVENIVDEILFVTDMDTAFAARLNVGKISFLVLLSLQSTIDKFSDWPFLSL